MAKADDGRTIKDEGRQNGQLVVSTSSSPSSPITTRRPTAAPRSWRAWLLSNLARVTVWYTIITILFRCPSEPKSLTDTDPAICRTYLTTRAYIDPFVGPYYDTYASPYIEKVRPYAETANTRVIKPATVLAVSNYNKYAAPQVAKASDYTLSQWEKKGLPQLRKAQEAAQQAYDDNLAPHVQKASEAATPYYETARENAFNIREKHIIPAITYSQPHVQSLYANVHKFALEEAIPFAQHAWTNAVIFVDGTLWPIVKQLYGNNVRPQLVMISERIAKYQQGRKLRSALEDVDASYASSATTETSSEEFSSTATTVTELSATESSPFPSTTVSELPRLATDETVIEDLVKWQKKFAVAADTGTDDLKERIQDIIQTMVKSDLPVGEGLANALEKTTEVQIDAIKAKINSVASLLPEDAHTSDVTAAEKEVVQAVRDAGSQIKERAKNVRTWADTFQKELKQRTELATDSTLHVLDDIRDLGLQEIGMRWAWMEGVTYKHWQKYHDLKRKFADWRSEVREDALSHPALGDALEQANKVLEESMAITENAAKELIRLKDVAKWKVASRDSTQDFDTRAIPIISAAVSAASSLAENIKDAIVGSSQGTVESLSSVASVNVAEASDHVSSAVVGTTGSAESLGSKIVSTASKISESASSVILGTTGSLESFAAGALSDASSVVLGTSTGSIESLASSLSNLGSSAFTSVTKSASSLVASATAGPSEGILSSGSSLIDSVSTSASSAIASASASAKLQDALNDAGERIEEFTSALKGE